MQIECPICSESYNLKNNIPFVVDCGHTYCSKCLKKASKQQCLICTKSIKNKSKNFTLLDLLNKKQQTITHPNTFYHSKDFEALFKISFVGHHNVGKTTIINYIKTEMFNSKTIPTIGVDFTYIDVQIEQKIYRIQLWDTAGQQQYRSIAKNHYLNSDIIALVYSVDDQRSFLQASSYWFNQIEQISPQSKIFLIGNKIDTQRKVNQQQSRKISRQMNAIHNQISCKDQYNVMETWNQMVQYLIENQELGGRRTKIHLQAPNTQEGFLKKLKKCFGLL